MSLINSFPNTLLDSDYSSTHHSILWSIWRGFSVRSDGSTSGESHRPSFEDDFSRCKRLTSLALDHGARIDECVHATSFYGNPLHFMVEWCDLQPQQWHQLLQYLIDLGIDLEFRNHQGQTPLLYAAGVESVSELAIPALLDFNADLFATDIEGDGYLLTVLDYLATFLYEDTELDEISRFERRLTILLKADPDPSATINASNTPLRFLIDNNEAWDIWTSVIEKLGWSMEDSESIRFEELLEPYPYLFRGQTEGMRTRMLEQTISRLGPSKVASILSKRNPISARTV